MEALERLMKNRASIVIAHHLGTILHADMIFFMKDHRLMEQGSYEAGGLYSGLSESRMTNRRASMRRRG